VRAAARRVRCDVHAALLVIARPLVRLMSRLAQIDGVVTFEHPLDVHYSCSSLVGWPKLLVSVWQQDEFDRHDIGAWCEIARAVAAGAVEVLLLACLPASTPAAASPALPPCMHACSHAPQASLLSLPGRCARPAGGYGMARVPMAPGVHALEVATWRPAGTALQEFAGA